MKILGEVICCNFYKSREHEILLGGDRIRPAISKDEMYRDFESARHRSSAETPL